MTFIQSIKNEILERKTENEVQQYVSDIFLTAANGSIKSGYQIDFAFDNLKNAQDFCDILAGFEILPKLTNRAGAIIVYIKSREDICNLLALVGATKSLMGLNNEIAFREVRSNANRRANCDSGNIAKQVSAASEQIEHMKKINLESLEPKLRAVAKTRIENPNASFEELAEILKISKSGLVHRMRKLMSM